MSRALLVVALTASVACVSVQELGSERAPETTTEGSARPSTTTAPELAPAPTGVCPSHVPLHGNDCEANVGWCTYRVSPREGLAAKCACGSDRKWSCLRVRDDDRRNVVPVEALTWTTASCTEGAPCAEASKCRVGKERACECMSSGRLRCERPVF